MASSSSSITSSQPSRADRDRLRDYYGLASTSSSTPVRPPPTAAGSAQRYKQLVSSEGVAGLLKSRSELQTEIRELAGERQSLVYNHHTDLVTASETIRKMKTHADTLSPTLSSLSASLDSMAKLEGHLSSGLLPVMSGSTGSSSSEETEKEVIAVATLPQKLRDVIALGDRDAAAEAAIPNTGLAAAEALWGRHEATLSSWSSQGIAGADVVASECRSVLREARAAANGT